MKDELRRLAKANLKKLSSQEKIELDEKIFSQFYKFLNKYQKIHSLGVYAPLEDEPQWRNLDFGLVLSFPKVIDLEKMEYRILKSGVQVSDITWNEKDISQKIFGDVIIPDLILAPALGFSLGGFRLGRGAGYYDRFLELYRGVRVGLSYQMNIFDFKPSEFDQKFDYLITENEILEF